MSWLKWVGRFCSTADFVLKVDDDVIPNMFEISNLLRRGRVGTRALPFNESTLLCDVKTDWKPPRKKDSKW